MANAKLTIADLPNELTSLADDDLFAVWDTSGITTAKISAANAVSSLVAPSVTVEATNRINADTGLQGQIDLKAPLADPALTGVPTAPTAAPGTNDGTIANTAFVKAAVDAASGAVVSVNGEVGAVVIDATDVGLGGFTGLTPATLPLSTATTGALSTKEPTITSGTTAQYWRGDKTFQPTIDLPLSTATISAAILSDRSQALATGAKTQAQANAGILGLNLLSTMVALPSATLGADLASAISTNPNISITSGLTNTTTAITLPFAQSMIFGAGASLTSSGSGSFTNQGTLIRNNYNPCNMADWNSALGTVPGSYEGFSVEVGPFGPRRIVDLFNTPMAISGAISAPATSTYGPTGGCFVHCAAVAGWAKNASTVTGSVALYGQAERTAAGNVLIWGLNTVTFDRNLGGSNVWGYELDMNIDNVTTTALGIDFVGGSTVEPNLAVAMHVQALGVFAGVKKRWTYALLTRDAGSQIGIELGATLDTNSPPQAIQAYYMDGTPTRQKVYTLGGDASGNVYLRSEIDDKVISLKGKHSGSYTPGVSVVGNNIGINNSGVPAYPLDVVGAIKFSPGTSVTPAANGDVVFDSPDNVHARIRVKGSDGTVRNGIIPLDASTNEIGVRLLFILAIADMNTLADQTFTKVGNFTTWRIGGNGCIGISWTGGNPSGAVGGIYTAAAKGGAQLLASSTTYTGLTAAGNGTTGNIVAGNAGDRTETPILSLTTAAGVAGSCVFRIYGQAIN